MTKSALAVKAASGSASPSAEEIDILYGLEPVYEAGSDPRMRPLSEFVKIRCPYCRSNFETEVETIYGSQARVEDCQICCNPIALHFEIVNGQIISSQVERA